VKWTNIPGSRKLIFKPLILNGNFAINPGFLESSSSSRNGITWKLTNGEMTQVPACHGFWGGYRTTKAMAWVIDVGVSKPAWLARHKDQCCGSMTLKEAKAAALAMAKGASGDYRVGNPTAHLNGMAARLFDTGAV
jgi:hypothetical protein